MENILKEITTYCGNECCSVNSCPEEACILYRIEKRVLELSENKETMSIARAKELIIAMCEYFFVDFVNGEQVLTDEEVINILLLIGFTEEELINEINFDEETIDRANALLE